MKTGPPFQLPPGAGNRGPGLQLAARIHHTLYYSTPNGDEQRSSVIEVADWIQHFPHTPDPTVEVAIPVPVVHEVAIPVPVVNTPTPPTRSSARIAQQQAAVLAGVHPHPLLQYALASAGVLQDTHLATTIPTLNLDPSGCPLTYTLAIKRPNSAAWLTADCAELIKLSELPNV